MALTALVAAAWALKLWQADLTVPFRYAVTDDTKFYLMLIKRIIDHGWVFTNHDLGAPFGQQLFDYPQGADNLNLFLIWLIADISPHPGVVINAFFLLTFPLDAAAAYLVMRQVGISAMPSAVCAVLFALLPYHFFRSDSHLFLSAYYSLPLTALLFLRVLGAAPLFARRESPRRRPLSWVTGRTTATVLICGVIASTGLYYAVFALVLLAVATLGALFAGRGRRGVISGGITCALVLVVLSVNLGPTAVYELSHGANTRLQHRATEGDDLSLSPSYLLLPPIRDRIGPLRSVTTRYAAVTPPHGYCEQCFESIGSVGDVGFLWLAVVAVATLLGAPFALRRSGLQRDIAIGVVACLVIGVNGGVSSLTRVFVTSDIRAWNRLSVVIAFFSLLAVGLLLDALRSRLSGHATRRFAVLAAAVLLFGIVDQTAAYFVPNYAKDKTQYRSDARFVSEIERRLPSGAEVLELPYVPFPEGYQPFQAPDQTVPFSASVNFEYELARPYIQSRSLRWSYGAMKGRAADWQAQLAAKPVDLSVAGAAAAGFEGLVVDPRGYPGALSAELARDLQRQLAVSPLFSPSRDLLFYDLRPYASRLRASQPAEALQSLRTAVLEPLRLTCKPGQLTIFNPAGSTQTATLSAQMTAASPTRVRFRSASRFTQTIQATIQPAGLQATIHLPPGPTNVTITVLGPGAARAQLLAPTVIAQAFHPFAAPGETLRAGIVGPPCAKVLAH